MCGVGVNMESVGTNVAVAPDRVGVGDGLIAGVDGIVGDGIVVPVTVGAGTGVNR